MLEEKKILLASVSWGGKCIQCKLEFHFLCKFLVDYFAINKNNMSRGIILQP